MNTELRRAIFVSIMSAQDYVDASSKIEKLNLKNKQLVEVPKVIMHCLLSESGKVVITLLLSGSKQTL